MNRRVFLIESMKGVSDHINAQTWSLNMQILVSLCINNQISLLFFAAIFLPLLDDKQMVHICLDFGMTFCSSHLKNQHFLQIIF